MACIKVSTLLGHNTVVQNDVTPTLGGSLNTNNFSILNGGNAVTITGNAYPIITGTNGQVLTTDGAGIASWQNAASGSGTVTSVGLTSSASSISVTGVPNPITTSGTFNVDLPLSGVTANTYGSASAVSVVTINSRGIVTAATTTTINITPSQANLGNVVNSLQVINNSGAPSIRESTGAPAGSDTTGAIYLDRSITGGDALYFYDGAAWQVISQKLSLYDENASGFTAPVATGTNSIALGSGAETSSAASGSLAIGLQSLARTQGGVVQASGRFASNGDAQTGRYLVRTVTINNSPTELFVDGTAGSVRVVLPDDSTWSFRIQVTAHRTDVGNGHAGYVAQGVIYRGSGAATTSLQGSINKTVLAESNASWDINITADTTNGSLKITGTGENGKTIRWLAVIETVEITN